MTPDITVIGLTGSIGMGKTTVAAMLSRMGCFVHSADAVVRFQLSPRGQAFEEVAVTFPECWDKKRHVIRRDILADIVFQNRNKREELERILHPYVWADQKRFIARQRSFDMSLCALDIPLLFETRAENRVDVTLCVSAPYAIQRRRVLNRPGMTEEKFTAILATQIPDHQKRTMADYVIPTGLGFAYTHQILREAMKEIKECAR